MRDFAHAGELARLCRSRRRTLPGFQPLAPSASRSRLHFTEMFLPARTRQLYRELCERPDIPRLGELADVGIGYVTGANQFFHLRMQEASRRGIPSSLLRPAVRNGRCFRGLRLTNQDWRDAGSEHLLELPAGADLPESVRDYLEEGERLGVPSAYKCRTRDPWYRVPHVYLPSAFLTYMSGTAPRLVANDVGAVAPNTLHILRCHPGTPLDVTTLSAAWLTAVARLSTEIEGHSLGGGMLKLEPTEAERVLVPAVVEPANRDSTAAELDELLRCGKPADAEAHADRVILRGQLGLTAQDCRLLRQGVALLQERRYGRSAA